MRYIGGFNRWFVLFWMGCFVYALVVSLRWIVKKRREIATPDENEQA